MAQGTFRSVVRPITKTINTDFAGVLDFSGRVTSFRFTSGQSLPFSSVSNTNHLIAGQTIELNNDTTSDIVIDASLMEEATTIDIEPDKIAILVWTSNGKFYDAGGTAYTKDVEETVETNRTDFDNHAHDGTDAPKIEATDLLATGATPGDILRVGGGGGAVWEDLFNGLQPDIAVWQNSDTTTNINTTSWTTIPIGGTQSITPTSPNLSFTTNGIQANFTGLLKCKLSMYVNSTGSSYTLGFAFAKNGTKQPGISSTSFVRGLLVADQAEETAYLEKNIQVTSGDVITIVGQRLSSEATTVSMNGVDSYLECEITPRVASKGAQGEPGVAGWSWYDGSTDPVDTFGEDSDLYLNTTTGDLFRKISGSWTLRGNIKGPQGPQGTDSIFIWAEENSSLSDGNEQWSFGNGSTSNGSASYGLVMPKAGEVRFLTLAGESAGAGTTTVELLNNGSTTNKSITLSGGTASGINDFSGSPYSFSAGDVLTFNTVLGGSMQDARIGAYIVFT